jgi:hypothetical protein
LKITYYIPPLAFPKDSHYPITKLPVSSFLSPLIRLYYLDFDSLVFENQQYRLVGSLLSRFGSLGSWPKVGLDDYLDSGLDFDSGSEVIPRQTNVERAEGGGSVDMVRLGGKQMEMSNIHSVEVTDYTNEEGVVA